MNLEQAATQVAAKLPGDTYKFDISIILIIMEIIGQLLPVITDICNKTPEDAVGMCQEPTRWQRLFVNMKVSRELGWREYRKIGPDVVQAIFDAGAEQTPEAMGELFTNVYYAE